MSNRANVPCASCSLCCRADAISLRPDLGDDITQYQTVPHAVPAMAAEGIRMLAHKPDLSCVYLTNTGCSIHDRAPALCREFDCRKMVKHLGYTRARKLVKHGAFSTGVLNRGLQLIATLKIEESADE